MPYFVRPGKGDKRPIGSMPGQFQWSVDTLVTELKAATHAGVQSILLFGIPDRKDARGSQAYDRNGIVQTAVRAVKKSFPDLFVITDVCLCEYMDHGHCGLIRKAGPRVIIDNDKTLELLRKIAVSQARAGADMVAPSAMMDGQVQAIREALDEEGLESTPVMAYSAKFASTFYGPFREAAESPPQFGDRTSYQMDPANGREALREIEQDVAEGADIIMVKPALAYLDILRQARDRFTCPLAAYNVSGEYSMVKAAAQRGWLDERKTVQEMLTAMHRAGADIIITYWAKDLLSWKT